jgi:hypothetical protein
MRGTPSTGPPYLGVQRHFEPSRSAKDCQKRAYELVPVRRHTKTRAGMIGEVDREKLKLVSQGGVAA